jgi:hypothetical protein
MSDALITWWNSEPGQRWLNCVYKGFQSGGQDNFGNARVFFDEANAVSETAIPGQPFKMDTELSLLRFRSGKARGEIINLPPTEDIMLGLMILNRERPFVDAQYLSEPPHVSRGLMVESIKKQIDNFQGHYHYENLRPYDEQPHVMVMSTGRCGTVSLYHLLAQTNYLPYHAYFYSPHFQLRYDQAYQLTTGHVVDQEAVDFWLKCRSAEWLSAASQERPYVSLMHYDTCFAPAFYALHRHSKFIWLRRNPEDVFKSFYLKRQWGDQQIGPMPWRFDPGFMFGKCDWPETKQIAWYIRWTNEFCSAMEEVVNDSRRFKIVKSDALFELDPYEIRELKLYLNLDLSHAAITDHFRIPINVKRHKVDDSRDYDLALQEFQDHYYGWKL